MKTNSEYDAFNSGMDAILRADPKAVKAEMEAQREQRAKAREAKKTSSLAPASSDEG
jgi:hypothetical protein